MASTAQPTQQRHCSDREGWSEALRPPVTRMQRACRAMCYCHMPHATASLTLPLSRRCTVARPVVLFDFLRERGQQLRVLRLQCADALCLQAPHSGTQASDDGPGPHVPAVASMPCAEGMFKHWAGPGHGRDPCHHDAPFQSKNTIQYKPVGAFSCCCCCA